MSIKIPLAQPDLTKQEIREVVKVINSKRLARGEYTEKFEKAIAQYLGVKYAVSVANGTCGLHLLIQAFGIKDGDLVITTPFSFIASSNCLLYERAEPLFVDIDPLTLCIDPLKIKEKIEQLPQAKRHRLKAILAVDVFGHPCRWRQLTQIARKYNLILIDDACEALGSSYLNKKIGTWGEAAVFAFYPNKQITTGEGGIIVTNNKKIALISRAKRNHGRLNDNWLQHDILGYNYRLDEMSAALGFRQMRRLHQILPKRVKVANIYRRQLSRLNRKLRNLKIPELYFPQADKNCQVSWFVYVIRLSEKYRPKDRAGILNKLQQKGIACSNYFPPIHRQPFYKKKFGYKKGDFPITESISPRTIALPFYSNLQPKQIKYIVKTLGGIIQQL